MKRFFCLLLVFMMLLTTTACSTGGQQETEPKLNTTASEADIAQLEAVYQGRDAYHGNLHDHSDSSPDASKDPWKTADGKYRIELWPNFLIEKDLDFVALVDHRQTNHMRLDCWDESIFMGATETGHRRLDSNNEIDAMQADLHSSRIPAVIRMSLTVFSLPSPSSTTPAKANLRFSPTIPLLRMSFLSLSLWYTRPAVSSSTYTPATKAICPLRILWITSWVNTQAWKCCAATAWVIK